VGAVGRCGTADVGARRAPLEAQADAVWTAVTERLGVCRSGGVDGSHTGTVLLDRALSGEPAHPLLPAACGHELARRAGLRSAVARTRRGWWTALLGEDAFLPIGYGEPAADSADEFRRCCAHQVAFAMLDELCRDDTAMVAPGAVRRAGVLRAGVPRAALMCGHDER
jgi:hypothetical protein